MSHFSLQLLVLEIPNYQTHSDVADIIVYMRTAIFRAVTQRLVIIPYRRFGKHFRAHLQGCWILGFLKMGRKCCPEKSVRNYHYLRRKNSEEHSACLFRCRNLKSLNALFVHTLTIRPQNSRITSCTNYHSDVFIHNNLITVKYQPVNLLVIEHKNHSE